MGGKKKKQIADHFDGESEIVFYSFRYFLGRQTIAACSFAESLAEAYPMLTERVQFMIKQELDEAFKRDDDDRANGRNYHALGDDCDRAAWEMVRQAYRKMEAK